MPGGAGLAGGLGGPAVNGCWGAGPRARTVMGRYQRGVCLNPGSMGRPVGGNAPKLAGETKRRTLKK